MGQLISGAEDGLVCMWDTLQATKEKRCLDPASVFKGHSDVVEDVCWHGFSAHTFASCGDDQVINVWDVRAVDAPKLRVENAHSKEVNCVSFSFFEEFQLLSGGAEGVVCLWDVRNTSNGPVYRTPRGHTDQVMGVEWSPHSPDQFASFGYDNKVLLWDLSRVGLEQTEQQAAQGPPELVFVHAGHMDKPADLSWNGNDRGLIATVADDNSLQVWQMAENHSA
jgi:histone-binding protein RBBP4